MSPHSILKRLFGLPVLVLLLALSACGGGGLSGSKDSPSTAPTGFKVTAIDSGAIVTWDQDPSLDYWIFYAAASSVTPTTYNQFPQSRVQRTVSSPLSISGLTNGTTYAFVMNSTKQGSPAGPATVSIAITPKPAGTTWTLSTAIAPVNLRAIVLGLASNLVTVGSGGSIYTSTDSTTWTAQSSGTTNDLNAIAISGTNYLAVGANGTIITSTDASTWTASTSGVSTRLNGASFGNSVYVVVGDGGLILTSADALSWTAQTSGTTRNLYAVGYVNSQFLAVGAGGALLSSLDGVTWTALTSNTTNDLYALNYSVSAYVAVGANGSIISSTDGTSWTAQNAGSQTFYGVSGSTQIVAVGAGGTIYYGLPSTSWTAAASGTSNDLRAVIYNGGFVAIGNAGAKTVSQ